jgi:GNAT superfamily N-acetyltransferase
MNESSISIRPTTLEDVATIAEHRHRMFVDDGIPDDERMRALIDSFIPWVKARIQMGIYSGWFALDGDKVIAGVGMMTIDWPPHPLHLEPLRGYLLNVYTDPAYRGKGIAKCLVKKAMEEAVRRKISVVTLHASKMGRPVYEKLGFNGTTEMRWIMEDDLPGAKDCGE